MVISGFIEIAVKIPPSMGERRKKDYSI